MHIAETDQLHVCVMNLPSFGDTEVDLSEMGLEPGVLLRHVDTWDPSENPDTTTAVWQTKNPFAYGLSQLFYEIRIFEIWSDLTFGLRSRSPWVKSLSGLNFGISSVTHSEV